MTNPKRVTSFADFLTSTEKAEAAQPETRIDEHQEKEQANQLHQDATPVATPASTPVTTPVDTPVNKAQYLDATHTASEQKIYSVMYRETVSKGVGSRHFGPTELIKKTGIRSDRTIRTALRGLCEKLSIRVVSKVDGSPFGARYEVFDPKEIFKRRKAAGLEIDQQTKKIITPVATPVTTGADTRGKNYRGSAAETTGVTPVNSTGVIKYRNQDWESEGSVASSSSESIDDDNAFLESVREVYERATGNAWTTADAITAQKGREIPAEVWGIAICYCVDRAPGHRFERLAYVLEEARSHQEEMKGFSPSDLKAILRHAMRTIERARKSGRWEPGKEGDQT